MPQQGDSIETLFVDIAARADRLVDDAEKAVQAVIKSLDKIDDKAKQTESTFSRLGGFIKNAFSVAAGIGLANIGAKLTKSVVDFGKAMVATNAQMQGFEQSFTVLTGSAEEAGEIIDWVREQAKLTPFDVPGLIQASQMLMTWGLDLKEWFTVVGDVASGMQRPITQVVNAIGTLASGQTGEAVRRFRDLGINLREFEALEFNAQGSLITPLEEAIPIVKQIMVDKFGGMMAAQSKTWAGVMSNLGDSWEQFVQRVGEPIFGELNEALVGLEQWVSENEDSIEQFADDLGSLFSAAFNAAKDLLSVIGSVVGQIDKLLQKMTGTGILGTLEQGIKNLQIAAGIGAGATRGVADFAGGLLAGEGLEAAAQGGREAWLETMNAVGDTSEAVEDLTTKVEDLTAAQRAGLDAVRALGDAYADLTDAQIVEQIEQGATAEVAASAMDIMASLGVLNEEAADSFRELTSSVIDSNAAFADGVQEYEATAAAAEEAALALEKLRQEQEANLLLADEVAAKLTDKLRAAMDKYEETISRLTRETAEAIKEIESNAAAAEATAIARSQEEVAKLRDDFAREQISRRRKFNLDWARLIREQNQEVIDAEWEYQFEKENLLIEGDEIALAELEARYDHEKDIRAREQGDAQTDAQTNFDIENQEREAQFQRQIQALEDRLQVEIENIRTQAAEEVAAKKAALEERLAHEDAALQARLEKIGAQLAKEVGDNQTATNIILAAWTEMYNRQTAESVNAGIIMRRELDSILARALATGNALANVQIGSRRGRPPAFDPNLPASVGLEAGGYTPPAITPVLTHPGEFMLNAGTTAALEGATGGPLSQGTMRSLAESRRTLDVNINALGVGADTVEAMYRELVDAMLEERTEF